MSDETIAGSAPEEVSGAVSAPRPPVKKKKHLLIWILVCLAAAAAIAAVLLFLLPKQAADPAPSGLPAMEAVLCDDGTACIALPDGTSLKIEDEEDVKYAAMTGDQKHVVVLLDDGTLYTADSELNNRKVISRNGKKLRAGCVDDAGLFYRTEDRMFHRYLFEGEADTELPELDNYCLAENSITLLYATMDGGIYILPETASEPVPAGTFDDDCFLHAVSDDGNLAVWRNIRGEKYTICIRDGKDVTELGWIRDNDCYLRPAFSADQKMVAVPSPDLNSLWLKSAGEKAVEVELPRPYQGGPVYTPGGLFSDTAAEDIHSLYVRLQGEEDSAVSLYFAVPGGDCRQVLSAYKGCAFTDGKIIFTDSDRALYLGNISRENITDQEKISDDVDRFCLSENGKYLYYMKEIDDEDCGNLYCFCLETGVSEKISSHVFQHDTSPFSACVTEGADGESVYFYRDIRKTGFSSSDFRYCGTLMKWAAGNDAPEKISEDVICTSAKFFSGGRIDGNHFTFLKFDPEDRDCVNFYFYDGTDEEKLASDVNLSR